MPNILNAFQQAFNSYKQQVADNKKNLPSPFFNNNGNNPAQWLGKVVQDTKARGPFEGLQDLTNPIIQNKAIYPYVEPLISGARMANYKSGLKNPLINSVLGQTSQTMATPPAAGDVLSNIHNNLQVLRDPKTRKEFLTGLAGSLRDAGILNKAPQATSNVPSALSQVMKQATIGFSPAAKERAGKVKISYTPEYGDSYLPMGTAGVFGKVPNGAAGVYSPWQSPNGAITIGTKYARDPEILRHELIHSMDSNVNFGLPILEDNPQRRYTEQDYQQAAKLDKDLADRLSIVMQYLTGLGVIDSRGLYPSLNKTDKNYINRRLDSPLYDANSRTKDVEGAAYMGTTGAEYQYPTYNPMTLARMRE